MEKNKYVVKRLIGTGIVRYGKNAVSIGRREATLKATKDCVRNYHYYIGDHEAKLRCISGFKKNFRGYKRIRDFDSWEATKNYGLISKSNRIKLKIPELQKGEECRIKYELKLYGHYSEIQRGVKHDSHDFYFIMQDDTQSAFLQYHIPKGNITYIDRLELLIQFKGSNIFRRQISKIENANYSFGMKYGKASIFDQGKKISVYWNINSKLKEGTMCKLLWYTKRRNDNVEKWDFKDFLCDMEKSVLGVFASLRGNILKYIIFLLPYLILILLIYLFIPENSKTVVLIIGVCLLVLLTHFYYKPVVDFIEKRFKRKTARSQIVTFADVNKSITDYSTPYKLKANRLLDLNQIHEIRKKERISDIDALREVIRGCIEYFNPKDKNSKRTSARLKYEILRMMAFENASESQIMWDLGFDVYTRSVEEKMITEKEPRFKFEEASEYAATSIRSFKRLKKEAMEMVRWRIKDNERKYIQNND